MSYTFSKRFRTLSIAVFLLGAVTAGITFLSRVLARRSTPYTMTLTRTLTPRDGDPIHAATEVRYQRSDGSWKQVTVYFDRGGVVQKVDTMLGRVGEGVFQLDNENKALSFISPMEVRAGDTSVPNLRNDPKFVREDSVRGYKTNVLRFSEESGSGYVEVYYAPALRNFPVKTVTSSDGGTSVIEMTQIELGSPSESEFNELPAWPVNYDRYEQKIKAIDDTGQHEAADQMRQEMQKRLTP